MLIKLRGIKHNKVWMKKSFGKKFRNSETRKKLIANKEETANKEASKEETDSSRSQQTRKKLTAAGHSEQGRN